MTGFEEIEYYEELIECPFSDKWMDSIIERINKGENFGTATNTILSPAVTVESIRECIKLIDPDYDKIRFAIFPYYGIELKPNPIFICGS